MILGVGKMVGLEEGRTGRFVGLISGVGALDIGKSDGLSDGKAVLVFFDG